MRPSYVALWTSIIRPVTSPAAQMCGTEVRSVSSTVTYPRAVSTPAASNPRPSRLPGQPTAITTASASISRVSSPTRWRTARPRSVLRISSTPPIPVATAIPLAANASPSAAEMSASSPGTMRGAISSTVTFEPKAAKIDASCSPVAAPPTMQSRAGTSVSAQMSLCVSASSLPGNPSRRACPPQAMITRSARMVVPSSSSRCGSTNRAGPWPRTARTPAPSR